jgi:hypothetical protein
MVVRSQAAKNIFERNETKICLFNQGYSEIFVRRSGLDMTRMDASFCGFTSK